MGSSLRAFAYIYPQCQFVRLLGYRNRIVSRVRLAVTRQQCKKMNTILKSIIVGFLLVALNPLAHGQQTANLSQRLVAEFNNAYPQTRAATGQTKTVELVAAPAQTTLLPPYQTEVWAYNQQVPGPVIRIQLGDTLKVNLINKLPQPTTIHWHGIRVPNAMDGVPGINQKPVQPGDSFTYEFTPKDAGTFWFHPHANTAEQVERGLHGVLIVEDPSEPQYSQEWVWVLDDWLLKKDASISEKFVTRHDLAHDGRWGNFMTINGNYQPTFKAIPGERIRIRMVNVANGRVFTPQFQDLSPRVIAVDGMLAGDAVPLERFYLSPGNRIDLDITIPKNLAGKKLALQDVFSRRRIRTLAHIQVSKQDAVKTPDFEAPIAQQFPQWLDAINVPLTHEYILNGRRGGRYGITWTIDNQAWPNVNPKKLKTGEFVRLRFNNKSPRLHPMHIHGQFFKVLARDGEPVIENYWRDTVLVGPKQTIDIGMIPLDNGIWVNHCHILEHAEAGMMNSIEVR